MKDTVPWVKLSKEHLAFASMSAITPGKRYLQHILILNNGQGVIQRNVLASNTNSFQVHRQINKWQ